MPAGRRVRASRRRVLFYSRYLGYSQVGGKRRVVEGERQVESLAIYLRRLPTSFSIAPRPPSYIAPRRGRAVSRCVGSLRINTNPRRGATIRMPHRRYRPIYRLARVNSRLGASASTVPFFRAFARGPRRKPKTSIVSSIDVVVVVLVGGC